MTVKAALCHMTSAQLRAAEVGLPVASQLATLAVSSNAGREPYLFTFSNKITRERYTRRHGDDAAHVVVFCYSSCRELLVRCQCHSL